MDQARTVLGIEFGSTRIKAVLLDERLLPAASGVFEWENKLENGVWTYDLDDAIKGLRVCFASVKEQAERLCGAPLKRVGAIGISGMMHGYLPFDKEGRQLAPFRTWRNTMTERAADALSEAFAFHIPQRWSIAHLYQAILNGEAHVREIARLTTLAGQIHYLLSGRSVMGVGEASGMFPIDPETGRYDRVMTEKFDAMIAPYALPWRISDILPEPLKAGEDAGALTAGGARLLDPTGTLLPGIPLAPCEGDAGTGMVATDTIRPGTGCVSAGTSIFANIVIDKPPRPRREIDVACTPTGRTMAMVHGANCTADLNAWVALFGEFADLLGADIPRGDLFTLLFREALKGERDCGGLVSCNYYSGEGVTHFNEGRPFLLRTPESRLTLANLMRTHLFSAFATLYTGMSILTEGEGVTLNKLTAHGGLFKTPEVAQRLLSAAVRVPVTLLESAGEGGPYGMALLAAYRLNCRENCLAEDFLDRVFASAPRSMLTATREEIDGFAAYAARFAQALKVERTAVGAYRA